MLTHKGKNMPDSFHGLTDPSYISKEMLSNVLRDKFFNNAEDLAVRNQAISLIKLFRASGCQEQVIMDILFAAKSSGKVSPEKTAEIGFVMGLQYGFELAQTYPANSAIE